MNSSREIAPPDRVRTSTTPARGCTRSGSSPSRRSPSPTGCDPGRAGSGWRIFPDLGVTGVWLGIGAVVVLLATDGGSVAPPPGPMLMIPVVLLVAATTGTLTGGSEGWAEQGRADGVRNLFLQFGRMAVDLGTVGQIRRSR